MFPCDGGNPEIKAQPKDGQVRIVTLDGSKIPGSMFTAASWYVKPLEVPGLRAHTSDEVLMFLGSDFLHPEKLNAVVEIQIENDLLRLEHSSALFIPGGAAHGNIKVTCLEKPVFCCCCHPYAEFFEEREAQPSAPRGTYASSFVDRYDTAGVDLPNVGDEVITRLFYLDGRRVPGAPYFESVWFDNTPAFLPAHTHDLDELILFAGADAEHPEALGGKVVFYIDGEPIELTRSCIIFIPRGVKHAPFEISGLKSPILHFSGGNNTSYRKS